MLDLTVSQLASGKRKWREQASSFPPIIALITVGTKARLLLPFRNFQTGTGKNLSPLRVSTGGSQSENRPSRRVKRLSASRCGSTAVLSRARISRLSPTQAIIIRPGAADIICPDYRALSARRYRPKTEWRLTDWRCRRT